MNTKRILISVIALDKNYIIYQHLFGIRLCSIVVKCWKSSKMAKIAYFHSFYCIWDLINYHSTQTTPCKYQIQILQSFPHPNMIKHWCWLKFYFWQFYLSPQYNLLHCNAQVGTIFDREYFWNLKIVMFYGAYFVLSMTYATTYEEINNFLKGPFLPLNACSPLFLVHSQAYF